MTISYSLLDAVGFSDAILRHEDIACPWQWEDPAVWPEDKAARLSYALSVGRASQLDIEYHNGYTYVFPTAGSMYATPYDLHMYFQAYALTGTFTAQQVVSWYRTVIKGLPDNFFV